MMFNQLIRFETKVIIENFFTTLTVFNYLLCTLNVFIFVHLAILWELLWKVRPIFVDHSRTAKPSVGLRSRRCARGACKSWKNKKVKSISNMFSKDKQVLKNKKQKSFKNVFEKHASPEKQKQNISKMFSRCKLVLKNKKKIFQKCFR